MKPTFPMIILMTLQGCSLMGVSSNQSTSTGDFNPLALPTVDMDKYSKDKEVCFKRVQEQVDTNMTMNNNIIKFRECLIQKGYVLLS